MDINLNLDQHIHNSVHNALEEDLAGRQDITAQLISPDDKKRAYVITKENMILCGNAWFNEVFKQLNPSVKIIWHYQDGDYITKSNKLCEIHGETRSILTGERTALNFLQMLSAVATVTNDFVKKIKNTKAKLLDTRKTIPGLRIAEKYAVRCGGGHNHRMGLYDAFLIKENHIYACGSITKAIQNARSIGDDKQIEIEVENLEQLKEAIDANADIVMLDNFNIEIMRQAVAINQNKVKLEVSGNVGPDNITEIALTGVDYISVGALTKNIKAIDLSMLVR